VPAHRQRQRCSSLPETPRAAAFVGVIAALCGVSPLDASSGRQQRHRVNRGGDRQANAALYTIVISRLRWDRPTKAYMARRPAEGRTRKEVIRCLKLYVAGQVHRAIINDLIHRPQTKNGSPQSPLDIHRSIGSAYV
jgi:transposase